MPFEADAALVARCVDLGFVVPSMQDGRNAFTADGDGVIISSVPDYMEALKKTYVDAGHGSLNGQVEGAIERYIKSYMENPDFGYVPMAIPGHTGSRFPGTHGEIVAISREANENVPLDEMVVSTMWTNRVGFPRVPGTAAEACPNCTGVLNELPDVTVLTGVSRSEP